MKTIICVALLLFVALTYASPAPDVNTSPEAVEENPPAVEGEELQSDESRWGHGGWGRRYGGWGGGYGGYGGWGRGYGGGWGHGYGGGWGHGYGGYGGWNRGWGWGR